MYWPRQDKSWMLSLLTLCVVVWLMVGCAGTLPEVEVPITGNPPAPEFETIWMPEAVKCPGVDYDVFYGAVREDRSIWAYGAMMNDKPVWYMVYTVVDGYVAEAWVDPDFDGDYDLYYANEAAIREAYPSPCDVLPSGPGSKV